MELDEIIRTIANESGTEIGELEERIREKQDELGGLVTPEGAAHIVANEIGINLVKGTSTTPTLKIENIIPGMNSVDVVGRVFRVFPPREFNRKDGSKGRVCSIILLDDTGSIRTVLWDKDVSLVEEGKIKEGKLLKIRGGYSKENQNEEPEIHIGMRGRIIPEPKDVNEEDFPLSVDRNKKTSGLKDGDAGVDVLCKVLRIYEPREFERADKTKGKVVNLVIGDETGRAKLVLWDKDVELVEKSLINEGDTIKVKNGYVKVRWADEGRFDEAELNVGRYGEIILNPEEKIGELKEKTSKNTRKYIKDLQDGDIAEIRGALVDIYDNIRIFDRADRKGIVVNAVIDDGTANMRAAFYDKMAETLMDMPVQKVLEGGISEDISKRIVEILGREVVAQARVRYSDFSGQNELVVQDINLTPDPKKEAKNLIEEANALEQKQEV
jgi:replication factor A1